MSEICGGEYDCVLDPDHVGDCLPLAKFRELQARWERRPAPAEAKARVVRDRAAERAHEARETANAEALALENPTGERWIADAVFRVGGALVRALGRLEASLWELRS